VISSSPHQTTLPILRYDLAATLNSGQAFRWIPHNDDWEGVIGQRWVRLRLLPYAIKAQCVAHPNDWTWLTRYLQSSICLDAILDSFPKHDPHLQRAVQSCLGLRLLVQDPWECLASFILSSSKQIIQIRQIIQLLTESFGVPVDVPHNHPPRHAFPDPHVIARLDEPQLRACKTGFRAASLLHAARYVADHPNFLPSLANLPTIAARDSLTRLPGVGEKIANCVLLFACGHASAFPVDTWILRTLQQLYFPQRHPKPVELRAFIASHFGPHAGYAQQYLFHYARVHARINPAHSPTTP
jgi:N-glycosylase/DNA lyase